jgi:hypothetical protein
MQFKVIDNIWITKDLSPRITHFADLGEGEMAILDPNEISSPPDIRGKSVTVTRPDGTVIRLVATSSEVSHGVVAIFFGNAPHDVVPRGSMLEWRGNEYRMAKVHSHECAEELKRLGWALRTEFFAEGCEEPYEYLFEWRHDYEPSKPKIQNHSDV